MRLFQIVHTISGRPLAYSMHLQAKRICCDSQRKQHSSSSKNQLECTFGGEEGSLPAIADSYFGYLCLVGQLQNYYYWIKGNSQPMDGTILQQLNYYLQIIFQLKLKCLSPLILQLGLVQAKIFESYSIFQLRIKQLKTQLKNLKTQILYMCTYLYGDR